MEVTLSEQSCKHCEHTYSGSFCPVCGQRFISKRITIRESLHGFFASVVNLDRGLWNTSWQLLVNPGKVIRDYLNGVTVPYFHPFRFLFLWLTIQVFIMVSTGYMERVQLQMGEDIYHQNYAPGQLEAMSFLNSFVHILLTLSIPFLALSTYLFFRKKGFNYAEHLVIGAYIYGETVLFGVLLLPIFLLTEKISYLLTGITICIGFVYFTYAFYSLFKGKKLILFFKSIAIYAMWWVGFFIVMMVAMVGYLIYAAIVHPEVLEQMKNTTG